eukprot:m51a1_g3774 putative dna excision repair protein ercc-6 (806) ;mRNA; r:144978-148060
MEDADRLREIGAVERVVSDDVDSRRAAAAAPAAARSPDDAATSAPDDVPQPPPSPNAARDVIGEQQDRRVREGLETPWAAESALARPAAQRRTRAPPRPRRRTARGRRRSTATALLAPWLDDGDEEVYAARLEGLEEREEGEDVDEGEDAEGEEEVCFEEGYTVAARVYDKLYTYQQVGVKWMWELHCQNVGGIMGDEMGLGKTVMVVSFLSGLGHSGLLQAPVLIACPSTLMSQWVETFHVWWPLVRVVVIHESGTADKPLKFVRSEKAFAKLGGAICISTYESVRIHKELFNKLPWSYVILDEGHKIRNPDAEVTLAFKELQTPHRIILSGTPIQNNLSELWSLFDFIFPGKLGTLPIFQQHFADIISRGGYATATPMQVTAAYKCAIALRDTISPYLLRRLKKDVLPQLPVKKEQVLMCKLTEEQVEMYKTFLNSTAARQVFQGKLRLFYAIDVLRKICNHPELVLSPQGMETGKEFVEQLATAAAEGRASDITTGVMDRSGKLRVVRELLTTWKEQGHKALLFCQTRQMLNLIEPCITSLGLNYRRMDGNTTLLCRTRYVEEFNSDPSVFVFLLTTKVGGTGLNLIGADRVIIYDPDWNPSVDEQARERVMRIGQDKSVTIYRLICPETIEERLYQRQLFKQFLSNKILKDPRQKRFFQARFMKELFTFRSVDYTVDPEEAQNGDHSDAEYVEQPSESPAPQESKDESAEKEEEEVAHERDDAAILRKLMDGAEIRSAISHDDIVGSDAKEEIRLNVEGSVADREPSPRKRFGNAPRVTAPQFATSTNVLAHLKKLPLPPP